MYPQLPGPVGAVGPGVGPVGLAGLEPSCHVWGQVVRGMWPGTGGQGTGVTLPTTDMCNVHVANSETF